MYYVSPFMFNNMLNWCNFIKHDILMKNSTKHSCEIRKLNSECNKNET